MSSSMTSSASTSAKTNSRRTLGAAIAAAVAASICCVGPLVLIALGASGAWMSSLTFLEPVKPLLTLATGGFLGYAVARVYAKAAEPEVCEPGSLCANPKTDRVNKIALWGVTALVAGLLMVPTFVGMADQGGNTPATSEVAAPAPEGTERVVLDIENMTCAACPHNVRKALAAIDGVKVMDVTMTPPRAIVEYDARKVTVEELTTATKNVGYPSSPADS
jgi:mercuric transport protein